MPATMLKNKVMYRQFIHSVAFVNENVVHAWDLCIFTFRTRLAQYFPTLSHKFYDFRKNNVIEHKMRVLVFLKLFATFLILRRNGPDKIINVYLPKCKIPVILVRFEEYLNFLGRFSKNLSNGSRVVPCERADR